MRAYQDNLRERYSSKTRKTALGGDETSGGSAHSSGNGRQQANDQKLMSNEKNNPRISRAYATLDIGNYNTMGNMSSRNTSRPSPFATAKNDR